MAALTLLRRYWLVCAALWIVLVPANGQATSTPAQAWKTGMSLYNAYEFTKASVWIRKTLQKPPAGWKRINKAYALVVLSLCQMNLANIKLSQRMYKDALNLARDVMLPDGLPENVKARYTKMRAEWLKQHPILKKNSLLNRPKKRKVRKKRKKKRRKMAQKAKKRGGKRAAKSIKIKPVPQKNLPFRYTGSVVVFTLAGAALVSAISLGVVSSGHANTVAQSDRSADGSATTIGNAYDSALSTGVASTVLWVVGPTLGAVGIGLLIYDANKKVSPRQAANWAPTTSNIARVQGARLLLVTP